MTECTIVTPNADNNGSLNGTSFKWYDELGTCYRFWCRVSGMTESDPTQSGETSVPFDISANASVSDICFAIQYPTLNPLPNPYIDRFGVGCATPEEDPEGPAYECLFYTLYDGDVTDAVDVDTGFNISVIDQGT